MSQNHDNKFTNPTSGFEVSPGQVGTFRSAYVSMLTQWIEQYGGHEWQSLSDVKPLDVVLYEVEKSMFQTQIIPKFCCNVEASSDHPHVQMYTAFGMQVQSIVEFCKFVLQNDDVKSIKTGTFVDGSRLFGEYGIEADFAPEILVRHPRFVEFSTLLNPDWTIANLQTSMKSVIKGYDLASWASESENLCPLHIGVDEFRKPFYFNGPQGSFPDCLDVEVVKLHSYECENDFMVYAAIYNPILATEPIEYSHLTEYYKVNYHHVEMGKLSGRDQPYPKQVRKWSPEEHKEFLHKVAKCASIPCFPSKKECEDSLLGVCDEGHLVMPTMLLPVRCYVINDKALDPKYKRAEITFLVHMPRYRWTERSVFRSCINVFEQFGDFASLDWPLPIKLKIKKV